MANLNQEQGRQPYAEIDDGTTILASHTDQHMTPDVMLVSDDRTFNQSTGAHFTIQDQGEIKNQTHSVIPKLDFTRAQTVNNTLYANRKDGNYSPRSKLEELSKSYMAESKVIK